MKKHRRKYSVIIGILLSAINCILLFLLPFMGLLKSSTYSKYSNKYDFFTFIIFYFGAVFISFLFCISIQATYKIKKIKNGFLFRILFATNVLELFFILKPFLIYDKITNMSLFVINILIISILKLITIIMYYFLYPRDKEVDVIPYLKDMWKSIFISIVIACMILFLTVMILLYIFR
jgi:hypothetical protein